MNTCPCGARFERTSATQSCPGCGVSPDADPSRREEQSVEVDGRLLPLRLWESEVLVNACAWLAYFHAVALSILAVGMLAQGLRYRWSFHAWLALSGILIATAACFIILGRRIRRRRATWAGCLAALGVFVIASSIVFLALDDYVLDLNGVFWEQFRGLTILLRLPPDRLFWLLVYPWLVVSIYMAYCLIRSSSRATLRECYRPVPLVPLWVRQPAGVSSVRVMIAKTMVLLAGFFGTTLAVYLARFFSTNPLP